MKLSERKSQPIPRPPRRRKIDTSRPKLAKIGRVEDDRVRVLVQLFTADEVDDQDAGTMAGALGMKQGVVQHHLEHLQQAEYANEKGTNYAYGHVYWALTPKGRQHVVERKLIWPQQKRAAGVLP
jgi:DNA-binding MarR family transcriptional regulator